MVLWDGMGDIGALYHTRLVIKVSETKSSLRAVWSHNTIWQANGEDFPYTSIKYSNLKQGSQWNCIVSVEQNLGQRILVM
jgi:hypothetical protein